MCFAINLKSLVNIDTCFGRSLDISASFHHFVDDLNRQIIANLTIGVVIAFVSHQKYRNIFFSGFHFNYLTIYWNQFFQTLFGCNTICIGFGNNCFNQRTICGKQNDRINWKQSFIFPFILFVSISVWDDIN